MHELKLMKGHFLMMRVMEFTIQYQNNKEVFIEHWESGEGKLWFL